LINLFSISIDKNPSIAQILDIKTIPALYFFKNGFLLNRDIKVYDYVFVKEGIMAGITSENVIKEIIKLV